MEPFCIPWSCVDLSPKQPVTEKNQPKTLKSFAQAVSNVCEIPQSQLPQACLKGDRLAIPIPEEEYSAGVEACKFNLHRRIIWPKGTTPLTVATMNLFLQLSKMSEGVQQNVSAQVWVRFYGLSQEYWRPNILFAIASSIGTPICIDSITAKPMLERTFGQFVRVLVDMDLSQTLRHKVLVERKGFAFFVDLDYENLPHFCSHCKVIGHHVGICKKLNYVEEEKIEKEVTDTIKPLKETNKIFVQTKDGRVGQGKAKEVINVDSDKVGNSDTLCDEVSSKVNEANIKLGTPSSSKINDHKSQQNRFAALGGVDEDGSISSKQQISQTTLVVPPIMQQNSTDREKGVDKDLINPAALFKEQDILLEVELNAATPIDTDSTQGSFVDATQDQHDRTSNSESEKISATHERVKKDMKFLNDLWANMADNEDEEARLLEYLEKEPTPPAEDSQLKLSKVSEPWMKVEDLPRRWLSNLQLKLFALNTRNNLLPNLWCMCRTSLNPTILDSDDQQVTFTITENNKTLAISAVYASTNYLNRRRLWNCLNSLQSQHDLPWCFLGDFNVILGAHEHRGRTPPSRLPMEEFKNWTDAFNLIHLPTTGAEFTWNNGRRSLRHTEKRLDRAICNQSWLDMNAGNLR
ncbi:DUF4283 domain protein [Trifolium medium]|uniref:DUF4283 domain protein n=1 Tax=Trifolium medium TaxID=97028 RepID=A0A392M315_9FABA|nr:DUF4283 domain protein [Trifolium medium]